MSNKKQKFGLILTFVLAITMISVVSVGASSHSAALGDFVWEDLNADGLQDLSEPGIPGVTVELVDWDTGSTVATTTTDANGFYLFSGLLAGNYQVRFFNPDPAVFEFTLANVGYPPHPSPYEAIDSDPLPDTGLTFMQPLAAGETNLDKDAGFFRKKVGDGCTPGYWKNHLNSWPPTGLSPGVDFDSTFGVDLFDPDITLEEAVNAKGGGVKKLARHGTAALLGALHPDVSYPLTAAEVIAAVQAGDVDTLVNFNELGCPIN